MKKLILLTLLFITVNINAQIFVTLNPMQGYFNFGALIHANLDNTAGVYSSFSWGDINQPNFYAMQYKSSFGLSYTPPTEHKDVTILVGFSQTWFSDVKDSNPMVSLDNHRFNAFSIGFFASLPTKRKMNILFYSDVVNWESMIGLNINLKKN